MFDYHVKGSRSCPKPTATSQPSLHRFYQCDDEDDEDHASDGHDDNNDHDDNADELRE